MPKLKSIKITVYSNSQLQKITKTKKGEMMISENMIFILLLRIIFSTYPKIFKLYPPGTLGLLLNGKPPKESEFLANGDKINISVHKHLTSLSQWRLPRGD